MGFDLALGVLVLISAIRGWLKGFLGQAIRLGSLVGAAYLAVPVRDEVKPYALEYLPTIRPELADRLLWWGSAVLCYLVMVCGASLVVAMSRRKSFGMDEPRRGDQFAGFGLGMLKGAVVACFLVSSVEKYGQPIFSNFSWAEDQAKESQAWACNARFHPAAQIWAAPPVKAFVAHVNKMGLMSPVAEGEEGEAPVEDKEAELLKTASRTPELFLSQTGATGGLDTKGLDPELARAIEQIKKQLDDLDAR